MGKLNAKINHITTEFDFDMVGIFKSHFRVHSIVVVSFRPNMVVIQTITNPRPQPDIETKGVYTMLIPLSSFTSHEYDCDYEEVNVMVPRELTDGLTHISKTGCINVVGSEPFIYEKVEPVENPVSYEGPHVIATEIVNDRVEVSFDIIESKDVKIVNTGSVLMGEYVNGPYPHFLIKSCVDFPIKEEFVDKIMNLGDFTLVRNVKAFKSFYSIPNLIIKVGKNESIIFDGSAFGLGFKSIIGNGKSEVDFECPRKPFKSLFIFMGSSRATADPNFAILKHLFQSL